MLWTFLYTLPSTKASSAVALVPCPVGKDELASRDNTAQPSFTPSLTSLGSCRVLSASAHCFSFSKILNLPGHVNEYRMRVDCF